MGTRELHRSVGMKLNWLAIIVGVAWSEFVNAKPSSHVIAEESNIDDATLNYLRRFGYLEESQPLASNLMSEKFVRNAIRKMQRFAGVPQTGRLDSPTRELMSRRRCGSPDLGTGRVKRYVKTSKSWMKRNLTWSLRKGTKRIGVDDVRKAIDRALELWSNASLLSFQELDSDKADILVYFQTGHHGDNYTFDGPSNTLAHAFHPGSGIGGDAHFDDDEDWVYHAEPDQQIGTSFFAVALHEFGHSLGLSHTDQKGAIMQPFYFPIKYEFQLHSDDVAGIQSLYGSRYDEKMTLPTMRPLKPTTKSSDGALTPKRRPVDPVPNTCDMSYDAVTVISSSLLIFRNQYLWRIDRSGLVHSRALPIKNQFSGLPSEITGIDAIYQQKMRPRSILIFSGNRFWNATASLNVSGPLSLTRLGLPVELNKLNAAFVWGHNGKTYFFNDTMYWRFDEKTGRVESDYPRDIAVWRGVPRDVDSAFQYTDGKTYFFKGRVFWEFDDRKMGVISRVPALSAPHWMGCSPVHLAKKHKNVSSTCSARRFSIVYLIFALIALLPNQSLFIFF